MSKMRFGRLKRHGFADTLTWLFSGEYWLTTARRRPNGGTVILLRSAQLTVELFLLALFVEQVFDPTRNWRDPDWFAFRKAVSDHVDWLGAIFAGTYAALYTRFASQWTYLAELYNQIKGAQSQQGANLGVIAEWKAGFIEDADDLHLVSKPIIASIIVNWASQTDVARRFHDLTTGKTERLQQIVRDARHACRRQEHQRRLTYVSRSRKG